MVLSGTWTYFSRRSRSVSARPGSAICGAAAPRLSSRGSTESSNETRPAAPAPPAAKEPACQERPRLPKVAALPRLPAISMAPSGNLVAESRLSSTVARTVGSSSPQAVATPVIAAKRGSRRQRTQFSRSCPSLSSMEFSRVWRSASRSTVSAQSFATSHARGYHWRPWSTSCPVRHVPISHSNTGTQWPPQSVHLLLASASSWALASRMEPV
mmetsp:Transcript_7549/g.20209  ORF Transcript_7549/g.20209 Transcript_7549/m.20209 type:complete len:213 (-) Transcript_7549:259-897(-)